MREDPGGSCTGNEPLSSPAALEPVPLGCYGRSWKASQRLEEKHMGAVPKGLSEQEFGPTWLVRLLVENGEKEVRGTDLGNPRREPRLPASTPGGPGDLLTWYSPSSSRYSSTPACFSSTQRSGIASLSFRKAGHMLLTPSSMGAGCLLHFRGLLSCLALTRFSLTVFVGDVGGAKPSEYV